MSINYNPTPAAAPIASASDHQPAGALTPAAPPVGFDAADVFEAIFPVGVGFTEDPSGTGETVSVCADVTKLLSGV